MTFAKNPDTWRARKQLLVLPENRKLAFIDTGGPNPPLLLLHGFTDSSRSFQPVLPFLKEFRLILPDMRGHGGSSEGKGWAINDFVDDLELLIETLQLSPFSIIGHSMGTMVALELVTRRISQAAKLVLISGSLRPEFPNGSPISNGIESLQDPIDLDSPFMHEWHATATLVDPDFLSKMRQEAANIPADHWKAILNELRKTDLTSLASSVVTETLCIGGGLDPLFNEDHLENLSATLPNCEKKLLQGHGHNPHWEDPERIASIITTWIKAPTQRID